MLTVKKKHKLVFQKLNTDFCSIWLKLVKTGQLVTGKWVDTNGGTHFLKLDPELGVLANLLFMFAGKLLQVGLEGLQLFRHLTEKHKPVR